MPFSNVILRPCAKLRRASINPTDQGSLEFRGRHLCSQDRGRSLVSVGMALSILALASCQSTAPTKPDQTVARRLEAAQRAKPMTPEEEAETIRKLQEFQVSQPMGGLHRLDPTGLSSLAAAKSNHAKMQAMQADIDRLMVTQRNRALEMCRSRPEIRECAELMKTLQQ